MPVETALALVVRGTDWSETSRITTLFTRERGKVRALARGGRRLKSNFEIAFDLLTVCRVTFIRKSSESLDLLTEATFVERFPALRERLPVLYAGYYIAELLSDGTQDYDPHPALFDVAMATLHGLGQSQERLPALVSAFELAWLRELGYSPRLDACVGCGARLRPEGVGRVMFSPTLGGVICPSCESGAPDRRGVSRAVLSVMLELDEAGPERGFLGHPLNEELHKELRQILGQTVSCVLGRRPKLLGYVDAR